MISDDEDSDTMDDTKNDKETISKTSADGVKLGNLLKRHRVYGDITQNATESQLERLLVNISENIIDKLGKNILSTMGPSTCFLVSRFYTTTMFQKLLRAWKNGYVEKGLEHTYHPHSLTGMVHLFNLHPLRCLLTL